MLHTILVPERVGDAKVKSSVELCACPGKVGRPRGVKRDKDVVMVIEIQYQRCKSGVLKSSSTRCDGG